MKLHNIFKKIVGDESNFWTIHLILSNDKSSKIEKVIFWKFKKEFLMIQTEKKLFFYFRQSKIVYFSVILEKK